jgi:hypothetical protein
MLFGETFIVYCENRAEHKSSSYLTVKTEILREREREREKEIR